MQKSLDKIQFESRGEIQEIMQVIEQYRKDHPEENRVLTRFYNLLDVMEMEW